MSAYAPITRVALHGSCKRGEDTHNHSYIMCREILFDSKIHDIYRGYGNPSIYIATRPNKTKKKKENEIQNPPPIFIFMFPPSPPQPKRPSPLLNNSHYHVPGPNLPPSWLLGSSHEHAFQSHPCLNTSVPHQLNPSIHPGYTKPKNTTTSPNAKLASSAADSVIVYLPHHSPARRLRMWLNTKHTIAHAEKLSPVCDQSTISAVYMHTFIYSGKGKYSQRGGSSLDSQTRRAARLYAATRRGRGGHPSFSR